ncbi:glycoside-pentoside-hexuronide (GPH):cation symporter [Parenemella sanctibonifatiensis]|uniref:glycoside-pentoside-hexuronide (GPH):cation symporter n=1 Tax=Parenemella sanctibonifatiensis TaxID=2016505 RepID=UPI001E41E809|nr:glycoside-pentoside-hexuronide (GPH):cation symporter [Parenemella sanctibonifatiensis]
MTLPPASEAAPLGPTTGLNARWRNRLSFGIGTLGRDMTAALVSMYLMYYLTEVLDLSRGTIIAVTVIIVVMRVFDAVNDPVMGIIVDNTRTRWGKFKPWILIGAVTWALATVAMFWDLGTEGVGFLIAFTVVYLVWEIAYTINDISFYGMLPALSRSQSEREAIGVVARICANIGLFSVVVGVVPVTTALGELLGEPRLGWLAYAAVLACLMLALQLLTVVFAREQVTAAPVATPVRELLWVIVRNDQLLWATLAMLVFMTGYMVPTSLGIYYFRYVHGDEGMYSVFALILGVAQLVGLAIFPLVSRRLGRLRTHTAATVLCLVGLALFWVAGSRMWLIAVAGTALFVGQAFIQLLMLLFIADCVEYGEWKLGRRNESITVSLQPFVYKGSNALGSALVGLALLASGIADAASPTDVSQAGLELFKVVMMGVPMVLMAVSWLILHRTYRLDEQRYAEIVADLRAREGAAEAQENPDARA